MKKLIVALFALGSLPLLTACNTVEGVGEDVEAGGKVISKTAKKVEERISD